MQDFHIERKVYFHHTDTGGVVYYATYLQFLEESRTEFCNYRGVDLPFLFHQGLVFPVVHVSVDYKKPAIYGDVISIYTKLDKIGNTSIHFMQEIKRNNFLLVAAKTIWACTNKELKPQKVPEDLKKLLLK